MWKGNTYIIDAPLKCKMITGNGYISITGFYNIDDLINHIKDMEKMAIKYPTPNSHSYTKKTYAILKGEEEIFRWEREDIGIYDQLKQFLRSIELSMENEATEKLMVF